MQSVAGRRPQIVQSCCQIDIFQFPQRSSRDLRRKFPGFTHNIQFIRMFVGECFYHEGIVICHVTHVNCARADNHQGAKELLPERSKRTRASLHDAASMAPYSSTRSGTLPYRFKSSCFTCCMNTRSLTGCNWKWES
jgi:hypothetical protein